MGHFVMTRLLRRFLVIIALVLPSAAIAQQDLDPSQLAVEARVPSYGPRMIAAYGSLWFLYDFSTLMRVDPVTAEIVAEIPLPGFIGTQREFVAAEGGFFVPDIGSNNVFRIDPKTNRVPLKIPVLHYSESIGVGAGAVWVGTRRDRQYYVSRFNAKSGALEAEIAMPEQAYDIAFAGKMLWVQSRGKLYRIDPATNALHGEPMDGYAAFMHVQDGKLYVPTPQGEIHEIDPATAAVTARYATGLPEGSTFTYLFAGGKMWFTGYGITLGKLDLQSNTVERIYRSMDYGSAIAFADGALWLHNWSETLRITPP
jgi:streptogramin lyase